VRRVRKMAAYMGRTVGMMWDGWGEGLK